MVQIAGKYQLEKNENLVEFLQAIGGNAEHAQKANAVKPVLEVTQNGDTYVLDSSSSGLPNSKISFTIGKEFEETLPTGQNVTSTASLNGNKITIKSKTANQTADRVYEFTDSGAVLTLNSPNTSVVAKRHYKRL